MRTVTRAAEEINREIEFAERSLRTAVEHAWRAGVLLREQRERLDHGEWLPWIEEHVNLSPRRAQEWMDLASSYARAPAHLTVDQALKEARRARAPERTDVAGALRGLGSGQKQVTDGAGERREPAVRREAEWTMPQQRKLTRARELLAQARGRTDACTDGGLSPVAVGKLLKEAAIDARASAAALEDLAFSFER
jgi:hypothetical protein